MTARPGDSVTHSPATLQVLTDAQTHELRPALTPGQPVSDVLRHAGLPLNTRCGNRGLCDGCKIELLDGKLLHRREGSVIHAVDGSPPRLVRACEVTLPGVGEATTLRIPARSSLRYQPRIVTDFRINIPCGLDPLLESSACAKGTLGVAVDIGTTTVALLLVDLTDGRIVAQAAAFNEQMHLGDDVVTRIELCTADASNVRALQAAVMDRTIGSLLNSALQQAGANAEQVRCWSIVGNTTMLHLAAGVDPSSMGVSPFTPAFLDHRTLRAGEVFTGPACESAFARSPVHLLPSAGAYIGADLTVGVLASGLVYDDGPSLLVDVGTNGEIILKHKDRMLGCATAAGPAFEGAGLSFGMRAGDGVISHMRIKTEPALTIQTQCIGDEAQLPIGLCGSAYIDLLAEGNRTGLLTPTAKFDEALPGLSEHVMKWGDTDQALKLGVGPGQQPIVVSQRDLASLLQAKAAIAAGVLTLLERCGLTPADVKTVYLAGGFGTHMSAANAIACGLLPGFRPEQVQPVGNTALAGAYLALIDRSLLEEIGRVARSIQVIELNLDENFESRYIDQLPLPALG